MINQHSSHVLGFGEKTVYTSFTVADREAILYPNNYIITYSDIIEVVDIGDLKIQLLRVVLFVVTKRNEMVSSFNSL